MSKFNYFRKCYVAYQIKGNESFVNMMANILPIYPLPGPWGGSNSQNLTFLDHGHVAYQIKGNDESRKMQAHILSLHVPSTTGVGSKFKIYR